MKYDKFFELAKASGIEEAELVISTSYSLSFSLFHGEIEGYSLEDSSNFLARGIINGKMGVARCDSYDKEKAAYLVDAIIHNSKVIEKDDPVIIFKGSEKYKKVNTFNKQLDLIDIDTKMQKLYELEKEVKALDERIIEVESVQFGEESSSYTIMNSHGLKLVQKNNNFVYVISAVAKEGEQVKTGYSIFLDNDFSKFDVKKLAAKCVEDVVSQLGGSPCESKTYKAVLDKNVVAQFIKVLVSHASAEEVQKNSSLFIGKLGTKIASSKITIEDKPLERNLYCRWFDDEGVATYNKPIIKNGVLQTYLHNLTTAAKSGETTTGNGYMGGGKIGVASSFLSLKPGKKSKEQLFESVQNGIYITGVQGLHAGMNPQSGNFSLQANGFMIENGQKGRPVELITISGNILDLFNNVVAVGSDTELKLSGVSCSSIQLKKIAVSGK